MYHTIILGMAQNRERIAHAADAVDMLVAALMELIDGVAGLIPEVGGLIADIFTLIIGTLVEALVAPLCALIIQLLFDAARGASLSVRLRHQMFERLRQGGLGARGFASALHSGLCTRATATASSSCQ